MTQSISSRVLSQQQRISSADFNSTQHESDEVEANQNTSEAVAHSKVQHAAGGLQIIHATNRRIRVRATDSSFNTKLESIAEHLRQHKAVKEASANEQTGSLVVTFDENRVSLPQMLEILQQFNIQQPETSPQTLSNIDPFAAWKSVDFWKEQTISFIPLMTGLAVTSGLGISGLAAIPVYMVTSNATRRVIDYLEPQVSPTENSNNSVKEIKSLESLSTSDRQPEPPSSNNHNKKTVQPFKIAYKVVHSIPGRIRLHVPRIAQDGGYGRRLERLLKTDPHVINVRLNSDAGSIAIAYQPSDLSLSYWLSLMELAVETNPSTQPIKTTKQEMPVQSINQSDEAIAVEPINQSDEAIDATTTSENQTLDISSFWADMKFSGLSFSLAYMANFPL